MQSRFYDVAEAGSNLSYSGKEQDVPIKFYEELALGNDIQSDEKLKDQEVDNVVLDLSTVLSGYLNHEWTQEFDVGDERMYETLEDIFGTDLAYHWESSDTEFVDGTFYDEVGPQEIFESIAELSEQAEIYYPDHTIDGLNAAKRKHVGELKDQGFGSYQEFRSKKNDYNKFRTQIVSALNSEGSVLHAMRNAGMYEEVNNGYDSNSFNSLEITEDDVIIDAAEELDGNTAIATFDQDFIESNTTALPPHLLAQMWS